MHSIGPAHFLILTVALPNAMWRLDCLHLNQLCELLDPVTF